MKRKFFISLSVVSICAYVATAQKPYKGAEYRPKAPGKEGTLAPIQAFNFLIGV